MVEDTLTTGNIAWKVYRLTEKAIQLLDAGRVDDAVAVVDNRERLLNLLATRADVTTGDADLLGQAERLNHVLLTKFEEVRERLKREIAQTHLNAEAHRAYHPGSVK